MKKIIFSLYILISAHSFAQKAVIIGKEVWAYETPSFNKPIIKLNNSDIVDIINVTQQQYLLKGSTDEQCEKYPWVQLKTQTSTVYVFGKYVYRLLGNSDKEVVACLQKWNVYPISFGDKKYTLRIAKNYSIGASDDEGLTDCPEFYPLLLIESNYGSAKLIMTRNQHFSKFSSLSLTNDDGVQEHISKIKQNQKGYQISIDCTFQEGTGKYDVNITKQNDETLIGKPSPLIRK